MDDNTLYQSRMRATQRARKILSTPSHYDVRVVRSGPQVLAQEGLTLEEAIEEPGLLLGGDAYNGGSTTKMDPFHPASAALIELRFVICDAMGLRKWKLRQLRRKMEAVAFVHERAESLLRDHGAPSHISRASTKPIEGGDAYAFEPTDVFVLMPDNPAAFSASVPPIDRATATILIMGALAGMPAKHPARPAIEEYVRMVANPTIVTGLLAPYSHQVKTALLGPPDYLP